MTTPREQVVEVISHAILPIEPTAIGIDSLEREARKKAEYAVQALSDLGAVVLMPTKMAEIPEGSTVHLCPPTVSLNWPEGAYQPFVNGNSKVYVNALEGK